ncbi:hypothetical protein D9613_010835 [Agrocybe pediades]|uniref:F-box domain-containing protein n=1 Tax=Agrocybe pediades TaxID=84607 RepID=A0A8H4VJ82_9AGAR|nr:hypothetical protein D9613_010835 [Agrocybe pediades]
MSALYEDLLLRIFLENTYAGPHFPLTFRDTPERPLITALHCSQVCRQWRSIFLSSSLIWGRLIDLIILVDTTDNWRKEIFARTGEAALWVYGFVDPSVWEFLSPFLQRNWRRVQVFVVMDINIMTSLNLQQKRWAFLKEPAPQLCRIDVEQDNPSMSGLPTSSLFGDDAPLLKDFSMRHKFQTNASWLSNLSSISFPPAFNMDEVLTTLRRMPRLEYLTVFNLGSDIPQALKQVPKLVLPNLRMLKIQANVHDTCVLLECITASPDCCLAIQGSLGSRPAQDNEGNTQYENAVKSYIMPFFPLHPPSALKFSIKGDLLVLEDPTPPIPRSNAWVRCFCIVLDISSLLSSSLIKELISSPWVPYINKFEFYAHRSSEHPDGLNNGAVISALDTFSSSAMILRTNDETLRQLLERPLSYTSTLFPHLITLNVNCPWRYPPVEEDPPDHEFLKLRKAIGRPVSVLDLGVLKNKPADMGYLEEHVGLLVKWETWDGHRREYLCGEGQPERLRFSNLQREI